MEERAKDFRVAELSDFYRGLLTEKQYRIFDLYYNLDYSLSEIAENLGITRQSVRDSLVKCRENILKYEAQLRLAEKTAEIRRLAKEGLAASETPGMREIFNRILEELEV